MIPPTGSNGYLPPGVHLASLEEVIDRFGHSTEQRAAQADSLRWLLPLCRRAGISRLILNGSFVTSRPDPNDVDCLLLQSPTYDPASPAAAQLRNGLPFLEIKIVNQDEFAFFTETLFASDRKMVAKGIVEVSL